MPRNERNQTELTIESGELRGLVADPPVLEALATGFTFVEGPVWIERGGYLLFSDIPENTIYRWNEAGGVAVFRRPSGYTNGNTVDREGRLLSCEHQNRRVSRTELDGTIVTVASHFQGKRLNSPNDIVVRSDGTIFFTDPHYGARPDEGNAGPQELPWRGVYKVAPDGSGPELLVDDFTAPNGLALSPDHRRLYIDDSEEMLVRAFDVLADGDLSGGRVIAEGMGTHADGRGVPDGMKVDTDGRLWVTASGGIWVMEGDGRLLGVLPIPGFTANCSWGEADRRTLYITARDTLFRVRLNVVGAT